jgi:hypothetical protein
MQCLWFHFFNFIAVTVVIDLRHSDAFPKMYREFIGNVTQSFASAPYMSVVMGSWVWVWVWLLGMVIYYYMVIGWVKKFGPPKKNFDPRTTTEFHR